MCKILLCASLFFSASLMFSQNSFVSELDSIHNEEEATKFLDSHTSNKGTLFVFNKEKHKTQLAKDLFGLGKGGSKVITSDIEKTHYKVIDIYEIPYFRASYVYLDGAIKSSEEIQDLQNKIISKYNQGFRFKDLAKMYSMDSNANRGGDLGWFTNDNKTTEFEIAIINSNTSVKDAFTLDFPENQAHYVVVKTYPTKLIKEIKVLKVTEKIK